MNISLRNGQYLSENGTKESFETIEIQDGVIAGFNVDMPSEKVIDCTNRLVLPTLTDLNVTIPQTSAQSLKTELTAAASGGIGRVCLSPQTSPINDTPAITKLIERNARAAGASELIILGAMTKGLKGNQLSEYAELTDAGCAGLSNAYHTLESLAITKHCLDYAHTFNIPIFIHPMEPSLYIGCMHNGAASTFMGLKGIPEIAETVAIAQLCTLAEASGVHLHFSQVSCGDSVSLIRDAKKRGLRITADVAIANLTYTDGAIDGFNSTFHTLPPLRSESDRLALIKGVQDGTIDAICSGHTPCSVANKKAPFAEAAIGMSTIENIYHYALTLDKANELPLERFIEVMNQGASWVIGKQARAISVDEKANLSIVDVEYERILSDDEIVSSGLNTPLSQQHALGRVEHTFVDGALVFSA